MTKLVGTAPNQVPTNADLGTMAYQDKDNPKLGDAHIGPFHLYNGPGSVPKIETDENRIQIVAADVGYTLENTVFRPFGADNGTVDLGNTTSYWKDFYLSGEIKSSSGVLELNGNDIGGTQVTIADDAVASITPPRNGGFMFVTADGGGDYPQAINGGVLYFDVGASLQLNRQTFSGVSGNVDVVTTDVTGTTGTDGKVTYAAQTGVIKIENRYGISQTFQITFL